MTKDEIVICWSQQIDMLQKRFDYDDAKELDKILWNWLEICNPNIVYPCHYYRYKNKGVSIYPILNYLNIRMAMYLNLMDRHEIELTIDVFDHVIRGEYPLNGVMVLQLIFRADYYIRIGQNERSRIILNNLKDNVNDPLALSHIHTLLNTIDNFGHPVLLGYVPDITNLSKALGYAEEAHDYKSISTIYGQIGQSFQGTYPALAISMDWQAQVISERNHDKYLAIYSKIQRVYCEIMMLFKYNNKSIDTSIFKDDAEQTLKSIDRNDIESESLRAFYDEAYGYVFGSDKSLYDALEYFEKHGAYAEVYKLCEQLAGKALLMHKDDELKRLLNKQRDAAIRMGDSLRLKRVEEAIKQNCNK